MISNKRMRERVLDICSGAGMYWLEEEEYFEDACLASVGSVIRALEHTFDLPANSRLRFPWYLSEFENPDTIAVLMQQALKYDVKT